jgi:recombination protein RecR
MHKGLPRLEKLIRRLQRIPYLASKNIYRVALYFLEAKKDDVQQLCESILDAKKYITKCQVCCNLAESESLCSLCLDKKREKSHICIVETWHDLIAIEKAGGYKGVYHVLGGSLCPLDGIGVDDLSIDLLLKRFEDQSVKEVIFATNPTPEGEATASYIASKMQGLSCIISKLASGVPIGSSLDTMDRVTVYKALMGRRPF